MNAPMLRFNKFNDDWSAVSLGECSNVTKLAGFEFTNYVTYSNYGKIIALRGLNIKNGELNLKEVKYIDESDFSKLDRSKLFIGDILFTYVGTIGEVAIIDENDRYYLAPNVCRIRVNNIINPLFLFHYIRDTNFKKRVINPLIATSSQPALSMQNIRKFTLNVPSNEEQERISYFLSILDKKIQLQQEKIDLLKEQERGYMQKVFSQELRFKDENGVDFPEWKTNIRADELFESVSNKNHKGNYPVLSATQDNGMVYRDTLERHMAFSNENLKSYKLVEKNDFIISLRSFQGGIEFSNLQGLVSPAYTVFRKKSKKIYEPYLAKLFKTDSFIQRLNATTYGIRDGKAISYKDFATLKFNIPTLEEQKKIVEFLDLFDKKILIEQNKLVALQEQKQAFMQQMLV